MRMTNPKNLHRDQYPNATVYRNTETNVVGKPLPICFGSRAAKRQIADAKAARKALRRQRKNSNPV